ncbi:Retrovirus Pol polyprotein from transposon 17.6 [Fasciola gigantica]|uniref:Retrovirus Pol polyprotein from transposon 17.6 n=1 Tax=Fasciola gigantica TaxID=46835 RepID=A0A504YAH1_FASGI|nr:Retrovirus Pol polyprotein from transposon 17.6 [Fasciola gigantica]
MTVRLQFQSRVQLPGERFGEFVRQLRNLARDAFPDLDLAAQEDKVREQITVGVRHQTLVKKFRKRPQITVQEALDVAREVEQLERLLHDQQIGLPQSISSVQPPPQHRPNWNRPPPRSWVRPYRPNPDFRPPPRRTDHGDCAYCRRFGTKARACGHNRVGESHSFPSVVFLCPFRYNCPNSRVILIRVTIGGRGVQALVDTGAVCSVIRENIVPLRMTINHAANTSLVAANGEPIQTTGSVTVTIDLGNQRVTQRVTVAQRLPWDVILGVDFLSSHGAVIDLPHACISIDGNHIPFSSHAPTKPELLSMAPMDMLERLLPHPDSVETEARQKLKLTLADFTDIFAWDEKETGRTGAVQHYIDTGDSHPVRSAPRRIPIHYQQQLEDMIDDMLERKIIQPSQSPWASPIVLTKKKDGSPRLCVDYRRLNDITKRDSFPLPGIDQTLDALGGAEFFSTLDLAAGYWQVEVHPEDRCKTAFVIPSGLYEFQTMPFGLANAPATFQRLMNIALRGLVPGKCLVYLDDIIVHSRNLDEHQANLREVFSRFRNLGLKLKPSKCHLLQREVIFLGHMISEDGVRCDPSKTEQVRSWPVPTSTDEDRSFLGLASYYRRFVANFTKMAKPLTTLLRKQTQFVWSEKENHAFEDLRSKFCTAPILAYPDCSPRAGLFI